MKDEVALLATVTLLGVLLQGGLASAPVVGGPWTPTVCLLPSRHWGGAGVQAQVRDSPDSWYESSSGPHQRAEGLALSPSGEGEALEGCLQGKL